MMEIVTLAGRERVVAHSEEEDPDLVTIVDEGFLPIWRRVPDGIPYLVDGDRVAIAHRGPTEEYWSALGTWLIEYGYTTQRRRA